MLYHPPMFETHCDILVVGGGPAGLAAARAAARAGASVTLVHRDAEIGKPVRTSGGSYLRDIQRLSIPSTLYETINELVFAGPTKMATIDVSSQPMVVLDITGTYQFIAEQARTAGASIHTGCTFKGIVNDDGQTYRCQIEDAKGNLHDIVTTRLVEASGSSRAVLDALGQTRRVTRLGAGIEYECERTGGRSDRATLFVGSRYCPAGYGWIFPTNQQTVRIGVGVLRPQEKARLPELIDSFMASDMAQQLDIGAGDICDKHVGVVPADGIPERLVHDRVVVAGDAASMAIATVGEGIRYGIEAGDAAGDAIAESLTGDMSPMSRYEKQWMKYNRMSFKAGQRMNIAMGTYDDGQWDRSIALIAKMRSREVQALLRAELSPGVWLGFALRHPWGTWRVMRRALRG